MIKVNYSTLEACILQAKKIINRPLTSREHAAMEPRHLGVKVVLVKSFARIHEINLNEQGMLEIPFNNENDYDLIQEDDTFQFVDLADFSPGKPQTI